MSNIIMPTNPADITKLKQMIDEAVNCMTRIASENELKKEIIEDASETFDIPKKLITKAISTQFKLNFSEQTSESEDFELLYESLYGVSDED
jgi:uncharacterized protein Yka (UPF0111/DUF47 family)